MTTSEEYSEGSAEAEAALGEFELASAPGHLMRRCQQMAVELYVQEVGEEGVTPRQFAVLHTVSQRPGLNQTHLVRATGIDRSTIADLVSRLISRGLLTRQRTRQDQRANELRITPAGLAALVAALPGVKRAQERILAPLPAPQRAEFIRCLQILSGMASDRED